VRVADTTEVSGRVTADEVNLDRFHNRIRKVCVAATLSPSSLRWMLLLTVLIVPQVLWGADWSATVGAQSNDKGRQALAFLPNDVTLHEFSGNGGQIESGNGEKVSDTKLRISGSRWAGQGVRKEGL